MEEFKNSLGIKIFYIVIAIFLIGFSFVLLSLDHSKAGAWVVLIPIVLLIFAILIILGQVKYKVIISADNIIKIGIFGTKELATANIKGCRIGGKTIYIEPISPSDSTIIINNYSDLGDGDDLVNWLKNNFKDLDASDLKEQEIQILHDSTLGLTEKERDDHLRRAKRIAVIYSILGAVIGVLTFFLTDNELVVALALAYPLIGIAIMNWSKGLIKFLSNSKRSVNPHVVIGFYLPALIMFISSVSTYDIFLYANVWIPFLTIGAIIFILLYAVGINKTLGKKIGQLIVMLILSLFYSFGSVLKVNCVFDRSNLQVFNAKVLSHRKVTGKSTSYYLTLSPWGPSKEIKEVSIRRWLYYEVPIGGTVKVSFKDGLLKIPWFTVSD